MAKSFKLRAFVAVTALSGLSLVSACNGTVTTGVYYDNMMWNDYYYPRPGKPPKPEKPGKPVHPIAPVPPPAVRPPPPRPTPMPMPRPTPRMR